MSVVLDAGNVQNTFKVPPAKLTKLSELELVIAVLERVSGVASVTVPVPTSQLAVPSS
jgi:hypothetical protein